MMDNTDRQAQVASKRSRGACQCQKQHTPLHQAHLPPYHDGVVFIQVRIFVSYHASSSWGFRGLKIMDSARAPPSASFRVDGTYLVVTSWSRPQHSFNGCNLHKLAKSRSQNGIFYLGFESNLSFTAFGRRVAKADSRLYFESSGNRSSGLS